MQYKVFVGNISPEGENLLTTYLNVFMPDAIIEPLKPAGIKGKMKNHAVRQDVALVIIDESLYQACVGVLDDVLALPKVHKYVDDDGLNQFLISKFGRLDGVDTSQSATVPPDVLMGQETGEEDTYIPPSTDIFEKSSSTTVPPDQIVAGASSILNTVEEDEFENLSVADTSSNETESSDAIINELKDKLASSEMMVRNLTLQLEDKDNDAKEDISAFVSRIKELETQLEDAKRQVQASGSDETDYVSLGKIAKAEQVIKQFDDLKSKLRKANEDKSQLEYDKTSLSGQIELLNKQIDEYKNKVAEIEVLRSDIEAKDKEISELNTSLGEKEEAYTGVVTASESYKAEIEVLQTQITADKEQLADLDTTKSELSKKQLEVDNLKADLETKVSEISSLNDKITTLTAEVKAKTEVIATKEKEINEALDLGSASDEKISELQTTINSLTEEKNSLSTAIAERDEKISAYETEIEGYKESISMLEEDSEKLAHKDAEIAMLQADIEAHNSTISSLNETIERLNGEIVNKDSEINKLTADIELSKDSSDVSTKALDKTIEEKNTLEDKLVKTETERLELQTQVEQLNSKIEELNGVVSSKDTELRTVSNDKDKLENEIESLQKELLDAKADDEVLNKTQADLLEERRKSAKLTSELEVLKKTDDSGKTSELRLEIARLKNELEKAKTTSVDTSELDSVKAELETYKERCATLEMDMGDKNEQIKSLEESVFYQMENCALPKVTFNASIKAPTSVPENFILVAGGSAESNNSLYSLLRRTCVADSTKRIVVVDLVTDSTLDREFGCKQINSPISWLNGADSIKNYVASTRYPNVRVISTSLAYFNDLYLLWIDWQRIIQDLTAIPADYVIINIGCLGNTVTKVLFNTLCTCMKSFVITKATPVNLRTVYLALRGFANVEGNKNVSVECVDYTANSANLYKRLTAKFQARILNDSDILKL